MEQFLVEAWESVQEGGIVMIALIILSLILYRSAFGTLFFVKGFSANEIRERLDEGASKTELEIVYSQSRREFGELVSRQVAFIGMLAAAAPLLGLLGTVSGMVETFKGLGQQSLFSQSGGVAGGIAEALLTTQIGLIVAAPAIIANRMLDKKSTKLEAALQSLWNHAMGREA